LEVKQADYVQQDPMYGENGRYVIAESGVRQKGLSTLKVIIYQANRHREIMSG
jgi:hypothetical protein